ncbi:MAG: hypothetical protein K8R90_02770 [Candidatus Cloacimonetes bacterium]|nr:hypothetical protein [Candidatus Cloacimonadota bacterium]
MHPRLFRLFVLVLSLALSLALSWVVGLIVGAGLFAANPDSALLLTWAVCIPIIYAVMRFYGLKLGLPVAVLLGLGAAALWARRLGDAEPMFIVIPLALALIALTFEAFWGTPKLSLLRNLMFAILAAAANTLAGLAGSIVNSTEVTALTILHDFRIGLLAALAISVGITLAERIYIPLAWRWSIPGLFDEEGQEPDDDEPEPEA